MVSTYIYNSSFDVSKFNLQFIRSPATNNTKIIKKSFDFFIRHLDITRQAKNKKSQKSGQNFYELLFRIFSTQIVVIVFSLLISQKYNAFYVKGLN